MENVCIKFEATEVSGYSSLCTTEDSNISMDQSQTICTAVVDLSDGKGKPSPKRIVLTSTHLTIQRNVGKESEDVDSTRPTHGSVSDRGFSGDGSFESFGEAESPPPEYNKREVHLQRIDGALGFSVRGGAEHNLPLIVSKIAPGTPAALCKQIYIGDGIISINGVKITNMAHDEAMNILTSSGPTVGLRLKYFPTAKPFLSPTQPSLLESNIHQWEFGEDQSNNEGSWEAEKSIPLLFAILSRYLPGTDRLRCNGFEVIDSTGNCSSGVIHCTDAHMLTSWVKCISDVINGLNYVQIKLWSQDTQCEIFYVGWVWEGSYKKSSSPCNNDEADSTITVEPWLTWRPKIIAIRSDFLYYMDYPPGVGCDWEDGEKYPVISTLLRILSSASDHLDERQHCLSLQIAMDQNSFPPNGSRQQPKVLYISTETRQELIKVETAWSKAVTSSVKSIKKTSFHVWWGGKPCQLELDYVNLKFNLYRSSSKPSNPLWSKSFSSLKGSSDDSRTKITLKFHGDCSPEPMECRDLHKLLFAIHSFLLAKIAR